ncbi:OB-fold domain-containing protein [Patulibacter defluvii]|uniref:OB-fold domain-containing protein n=1 Tax=Patulibacter defluvii TaxID=3095358 RepID=UPI002A760975|nr:OB-fold domain-containing protein [Patulibacter sp. DM4]
MTTGIHAYAAYVPRFRLSHGERGDALGQPGGRGERTVASFDEDTTTMAVEAARRLPAAAIDGAVDLWFATTAPAYADKANATAIHAALGLDRAGFAVDLVGSVRSAVGALRAAAAGGGLAVLSDLRGGRPGSADERDGGDGAAALRFGPAEGALAVVVAHASATAEFLDRWRAPGEAASRQWEERFGLERYLPLVEDAVARALATAGLEEVDHVVVSSPHARSAAQVVRRFPGRTAAAAPAIGACGAADPGLRLAAVLDRAGPDETILLVVAADGADALVLRTTAAIARDRPARTAAGVAAQLAGGRPLRYATYLTWRGLLEREPPRRPEPDRPAAPPSARSAAWKFAFTGARCRDCGFVHVPPIRVCKRCHAVDRMEPLPLAGRAGTVATFTVDRLAFSPSPPLTDVVVDFDGGGRCTLELTDGAPDEVAIGTRVETTFRRLYTVEGVHNYFWKARPLAVAAGED